MVCHGCNPHLFAEGGELCNQCQKALDNLKGKSTHVDKDKILSCPNCDYTGLKGPTEEKGYYCVNCNRVVYPEDRTEFKKCQRAMDDVRPQKEILSKEELERLADITRPMPPIAVKEDPVNHPKHYTQHPSGVECIEITEHFNFNLGNAIKYIWRAGLKSENSKQDLKKARWYLERELGRVER